MNKLVKSSLIKGKDFKKISLSKNKSKKERMIESLQCKKIGVLSGLNKNMKFVKHFFDSKITEIDFIRQCKINYCKNDVLVKLEYQEKPVFYFRLDKCSLEQLINDEFGGKTELLYSPLRNPSDCELLVIKKVLFDSLNDFPFIDQIFGECSISFMNIDFDTEPDIFAGWNIKLPSAYCSESIIIGLGFFYLDLLSKNEIEPICDIDYQRLSYLFKQKLLQIPVKMNFSIGNTNIPASIISQLEINDVLPIALQSNSTLTINTIPMFQASIHSNSNKYVAKINSLIEG